MKKFNTFEDVGRYVINYKRSTGDKEYGQGRNVESIGLEAYKKDPSAWDVKDVEEGRVPDPGAEVLSRDFFRSGEPYDPEERGVVGDVLKTLGNIPFSSSKMVEDIKPALNPQNWPGIVEALARGSAGAGDLLTQELGFEPTTDPDRIQNIQTAQDIYKDFTGSFSPRNIIERPLDALSNLAFGAGAGLKLAKGAAKIARGATAGTGGGKIGDFLYKTPTPERKIGDRWREARAAAAEKGGYVSPGTPDKFSLESLANVRIPLDITEKGIKRAKRGDAIQRAEETLEGLYRVTEQADPTNIALRMGARTVAGGGKLAWGASKFLGNEVKKLIYDPTSEIVKRGIVNASDVLSKTKIGEGLTDWVGRQDWMNNRETRGKRAWDRLRGVGRSAVEGLQSQAEKTFGDPVKAGNLWRGVLSSVFSFTWDKDPRLVTQLFDIAESDKVIQNGKTGSQMLLDAIRQPDAVVAGVNRSGDAIVARRVLKNITDSVKKYVNKKDEIQSSLRDKLKLDQITVGVVDFRKKLNEALSSAGIKPVQLPTGEIAWDFDPFFGKSGQSKIREMLDAVYSDRFGNDFITLDQLDKFKQMIGDARYDKASPPNTNTKNALNSLYGVTRDYIGEIADDPIRMNAQLVTLKKQQDIKWQRQKVAEAYRAQGKKATDADIDLELSFIPQENLRQATDQALGELTTLEGGDYSLAMRQYHDYVTFLDGLQQEFGLAVPETKMMAKITDEGLGYEPKIVMDSAGKPVYEEVENLIGIKDGEVLDRVKRMFGNPLAYEHFLDLARATDSPGLIPEIIGLSLRENIAGGLAPRGVVGAETRALADIGHPLMVITAVAEFLPAIAMFSPKFGSQVLVRALSPETKKLTNKYLEAWRKNKRSVVEYMKDRIPEDYDRFKSMVAEDFGVNAKNVKLQDVEQYFDEYYSIDNALANLPEEKYNALRFLVKSGRLMESGERAVERENKREPNNILTQVSPLSNNYLAGQSVVQSQAKE